MRTDRSAPILAIAALGLAGLLAGCATAENERPFMGGPDNFGEANRQTMAAQIIDPMPVYDTQVPETSAENAAQAVERYRTDRVKRPVRQSTSNVGSQGNGSSGDNSSGGGSN